MGSGREARAAAGGVRGGVREQPARDPDAAPAAGLPARLLLRVHVPRRALRLAREAAARRLSLRLRHHRFLCFHAGRSLNSSLQIIVLNVTCMNSVSILTVRIEAHKNIFSYNNQSQV